MSYLLDTNVISELVRAEPNPKVETWVREQPDDALYLSVLTLGEIRRGVEKLPPGRRKESLRVWLEVSLPGWFGNRLLEVDAAVADTWGRLLAATGRPVPAVDSLLAATALHHRLRLATRNTADFTYPDLEVVNPWNQ